MVFSAKGLKSWADNTWRNGHEQVFASIPACMLKITDVTDTCTFTSLSNLNTGKTYITPFEPSARFGKKSVIPVPLWSSYIFHSVVSSGAKLCFSSVRAHSLFQKPLAPAHIPWQGHMAVTCHTYDPICLPIFRVVSCGAKLCSNSVKVIKTQLPHTHGVHKMLTFQSHVVHMIHSWSYVFQSVVSSGAKLCFNSVRAHFLLSIAACTCSYSLTRESNPIPTDSYACKARCNRETSFSFSWMARLRWCLQRKKTIKLLLYCV